MSDADRPAVPAPAPAPAPLPALPEPVLARQNRLRLSLVWVVPILAVIVGAVLVARSVLQAGPEITIALRSGEGIEPGRTEVRFKEVVVGHVKRVRLGADRRQVLVTAALDKGAASLAVADTRFWVVRPRIGTAGVSGLGTLLSGAYIGVDAGAAIEPRTEFDGLDTPPLVLRGEPGRSFVLDADDLGSLDVGSTVYHRRVRVGRVVGFTMDAKGKLEVQIFVEAPHEKLVAEATRFWHASGVDLALGANGLTLNTQSLASVVAGGLAFGTPRGAMALPEAGVEAASGRRFRLHGNERQAMAPEVGEPLAVRMVFGQALRGLGEGAPVELQGVEIGTVRSVMLKHDAPAGELPVEVLADIYPQRLGKLRERFAQSGAGRGDRLLLKQLVERGLRAQARSGNLLTGRLFVALEFSPKAKPVPFDAQADVPLLPTVPGALADLQPQLAEIVARLSKVRFDEIGGDLQGTLRALNASAASLQSAIGGADAAIRELSPPARASLEELRKTLAAAQQTLQGAERALQSADRTLQNADRHLADPQAPLQRNANQALQELQRAAQAMRVLADQLQRHPQSLLRGKPADAEEGPR